MLTYLWAKQLAKRPLLRDSMFRDRADQFKTRLNWQVKVDQDGFEKDEYDALDPLYVIWESPQGLHQGSLRLLPTTGRTMIEDHFSHLLDAQMIPSSKLWECSRFCLARHAPRHVASNLMLAAGEAMVGFGVTDCIAIFDQRMMRIYRLLGAQPRLIGSSGRGKDFVGVGIWTFTSQNREALSQKAGVSAKASAKWFDYAFGSSCRKAKLG